MQLTTHAEQRIRQRGIPRNQVLRAFDCGMVMLSWDGARIAMWGRIRAVAKGQTVLTAYWKHRRKGGRHRKGKGKDGK